MIKLFIGFWYISIPLHFLAVALIIIIIVMENECNLLSCPTTTPNLLTYYKYTTFIRDLCIFNVYDLQNAIDLTKFDTL